MSHKKKSALSIKNKKASHDFNLLEFLEVGIILKGNEVKSIRQGKVQLKESFARIENNELWLHQCHITPYAQAHGFSKQDPVRPRKLLIHKKELKRWYGKIKEKGFTLVATKMYLKGQYVKLEIALAKSKKLYDKRDQLKEKDIKRDI